MLIGFPTSLYGNGTPFSPAQIPGLQLWLDGADAATITQSAGAVSQWTDKSGNAYAAAQATGGARPSYSATGLNGLGALTFDGTSGFLSISGFNVPTTFTAFLALDVLSTPQASFSAFLDAGFSTQFLLGFDSGGTKITATVNNVFATSAPAFTTGGAHQALFSTDGTAGVTAFDSISSSYTSSAAAGGSVTANIGVFNGANYINATVGEMLLYGGTVAPAYISTIQAYLRKKWGTP